jgi:hypothetical protein
MMIIDVSEGLRVFISIVPLPLYILRSAKLAYYFPLKLNAQYSFERSVNSYQTIRDYMLGDNNVHSYRQENLRSLMCEEHTLLSCFLLL